MCFLWKICRDHRTDVRRTILFRRLALLAVVAVIALGSRPSYGIAEKEARNAEGASGAAWSKIDEGRAQQRRGKFQSAIELFEAAEREARGGSDLLGTAAAINCRALVLMDQKNYTRAATLLIPLPLKESDPQGFVFKYNCGRAWEKAGEPAKALSNYTQSLRLRPDYETASDAAFDLVMKGDGDVAGAIALAQLLLERGQYGPVTIHTLEFLEAHGSRPQATALVTELARSYTAASLSYQSYEKTHARRLAAIGEKHAALRRSTDLLTKVFLDKEIAIPEPRSQDLPPPTQDEKVMSALLKMIGDGYANDSLPQPAVSRYLTAWRIDPANTDAVAYYASLLRSSAKQVDPDGERLRGLIRELIDIKTEKYRVPLENGEDYLSLMRIHAILASIFDQRGSDDSGGPLYTAEYHWKQAVKLQDELKRKIDPTFTISPAPYIKLADAQRKNPNTARDAFSSYLAAANIYKDDANKGAAAKVLDAAKGLMPTLQLSPKDRSYFETLSGEVMALPDPVSREGAKLIRSSTWLPSEYRAAANDVTPEQAEKLKSITDKFETQIRSEPLKSTTLEEQKRKELDGVLDTSQRAKVERARVEAKQSAK